MCFFSSPDPAPAPPPPPPAVAPPPIAEVKPAEGTNRKDSQYMSMNRGRSSLRIDRTQPNTGSSGSGLNIPT